MKEFVLSGAPASLVKIDYKKELNPEQLEVVLNGDGPCLVLAGAGSGKTRTVTYRVAYLIERGVPADQILLLTFTNKASKEMLSRVEGLLHADVRGLWGGTFHSVANRILRTYAHEVGHTPSFTILDQEDAKDMVKLCVKELAIDTTARRFPSPGNVHAMISYGRNAGLTMRDAVERKQPSFFELVPIIERVAELYETRKRQANAMDFDDLLLLLRKLLLTRPDIRDRLSSQFRYVLVDEYQDTNVIQADIVRELASAHRNILVVGDDAQSIYSFRAAEIRNILGFPDLYDATNVFRLTTNYRSTPEILHFANAVIRSNKEQFKKELQSVRPAGEKPQVVPAPSSATEAQFIAERLLQLRDAGVPFPEIAVLFRAAFHSQALEFELMKRDIPYEYRGGMKFFERAHVKDVVSHLRLVSNPKDEMAWLRILGLQDGIGLQTAGKVMDQIRGHDVLDTAVAATLTLGTRAARGWTECANTLKRMLATDRTPSPLIRALVGGTYRAYLEAEYPDAADRLEDLEQFALFAESYTDLKTFLDEVSLTDEYGGKRTSGPSEEKIVLSTVHQAKGLEWSAVFVMNVANGKFPNQHALDENGGLEEERRLFYVAATRAKKYLFFTYPLSSGYDTLTLNQPSQFLQELPENIIEEIRLRSPSFRAPTSFLHADDDDEIAIVLDDLGEAVPKKKPVAGSFLREVHEL